MSRLTRMAGNDDWKRRIAGRETLRALHEELRDGIRSRWDRSLPFAEALFNRWERAEYLGFGPRSSVYDACLVFGAVQVGHDTWVGPFTILDGSGGLTIGHHCNVSAGVQVYTHDTVAAVLTGGEAPPAHSAVSIGDCTYIGPNAVVTRGVRIGSQCVVGACALVNRDLPDRSIAFGVPARVVGKVEVSGADVRFVYDDGEEE